MAEDSSVDEEWPHRAVDLLALLDAVVDTPPIGVLLIMAATFLPLTPLPIARRIRPIRILLREL